MKKIIVGISICIYYISSGDIINELVTDNMNIVHEKVKLNESFPNLFEKQNISSNITLSQAIKEQLPLYQLNNDSLDLNIFLNSLVIDIKELKNNIGNKVLFHSIEEGKRGWKKTIWGKSIHW